MSLNSSQNGAANVNGYHFPLDDAGERSLGDCRLNGGDELSSILGSPVPFSPVSETGTAPSETRGKVVLEQTEAEAARIPRWKHLLDLVCIWLTFPLWLTVMALVATWVLFASPGPLLYRQERIGYRGRRFMILKFRTMKMNVETQSHEGYFERLMQTDCPMTKLDRHDARLIRGGRVLRALGLDELPQLINVMRGEMSLVGPRPCTPHEFERYKPAQKERVNAPPGLTGYWQVNGKNKTTFNQMIAMDIYYASHMSLWMDLAIMLKTAPAIAAQVSESLTRKTGAKLKPILKAWRSGGR